MRGAPRRPFHGSYVIGLLVFTFVAVVGLGYQAVSAARAERATAGKALGDYARFAAENFADRFTRDIDFYGMYPPMVRLADLGAGPGLTVEDLARDANRNLTAALPLVDSVFSVPLGETYGTPPRWTVFAAQAERAYDSTWGSALAWQGTNLVVYRVVHDETPRVFGFTIDSTELKTRATTSLERGALLPTSLIGDIEVDSLIAIELATSDRTVAWLTRPLGAETYEGRHAGYFDLGPRFADLRAIATIRPGMETILLPSRLPTARIPLTLGLAVVNGVLILLTIGQLRRERELARLRTEFVSNVSHELRTPLAQIRMFAETLVLGRVHTDDERQRSLGIIDKEARRLTTLVENVLHFSRAERQVTTYAPEPVDVAALVTSVIETFRPIAETQHASLEVHLEPLSGILDRSLFQQVLLNYLDNAVKYGPEGQVVRITLARSGEEIVLSVEDEGPGIPPGEDDRIWSRFFRLRRERQSAVAGTGIGLAVVRELAAVQGGRAWVESGLVGARFRLAIPLREPQPEATAPGDQREEQA